jgi:putative ABC transport system substrate-binding protein
MLLPLMRMPAKAQGHSMINRRSWLLGALSMATVPFVAHAQAPPRSVRIGLLASSSPSSTESGHIWGAFFQALRDFGWAEGQNVVFEGRYYGDSVERLPAFAAELVSLQVDVIVAGAPPAPEAARRATSVIPIVMANHSDPVVSKLVTSLARPGGNVTGLSMLSREMRVKQLQLLREILPQLTSVAFLRHRDIPLDVTELEISARSLRFSTHVIEVRAPNDLPDAFSMATRQRAGAMSVLAGSMFFAQRALIAELAIKSRLPTVYLLREHAAAGGLLTYGVDLRDNYRRAAGYVDKILRGARPGDLPIEQPTKLELVINLKTAKALGMTIPRSVLARADQIIE